MVVAQDPIALPRRPVRHKIRCTATFFPRSRPQQSYAFFFLFAKYTGLLHEALLFRVREPNMRISGSADPSLSPQFQLLNLGGFSFLSRTHQRRWGKSALRKRRQLRCSTAEAGTTGKKRASHGRDIVADPPPARSVLLDTSPHKIMFLGISGQQCGPIPELCWLAPGSDGTLRPNSTELICLRSPRGIVRGGRLDKGRPT